MELIKRLNKLGISFNLLEPDQLEIIADDYVLTDEILTDIKRCKQEILDYLRDLKEKGKSKFAQVVEKKEYYRLSSAQKRMFFLQQLDTKAISYNVPYLFSLNGKIDIKKIEQILKSLIERHEIFRTSFYILGMEPVQRVHKSVEFKLDYFEASTTEAKKIIKSYIKPFDLSKAPLIRSAIIKVSDDLYIWILDFHHIVTDGTTVNIIKEEFLTKYGDIELPILKYQYKDFSEFQNRLIESGEIARQEEYWLELYSDDIPTIALPEDFTRPEIFTFKGDDLYFTIDSKETNKLRKLAFEGGGTMYMSLLAALNALFYKYTKQTDIIIGCGVAGRKDSSFQRTAGMYVNSLAMRNYPSGERKYRDFLKEVIQNSIKAFNNQDMQFEELVEKLKLDRDTSRNPIFDICMLIQNFEEIQEVTDDFIQVFSDDNDLINQSENRLASIFDMNFSIEDKVDKIDVRLEYYTDVYKRSTIEKLVFYFQNLIKSICDNPEMRLDDIDILGQLGKQQILHEFNHENERFPSNKLIHEIFEEQADQYPDNVAILSGDEYLTYKELEGYSNQIAHYLKDGNSVEQGMVIGVYMDKCPSLIISILGILKIGCSYLPLSASYPEDRIIDMINDASACIVIGSKEYAKELNRFQWSCQSLNTYLCIDSFDIYQEIESLNSLNDRKLWEYVGEESFDDITGGGWTSSYTGLPISKKEMDEYGENIVEKLTPLLTRETRILEIGCASGISMFRIAPKVGFYYGTDLSSVILDKNRIRIEAEGHNNIQIKQIPAHEIGEINECDFDIVIINSVIQCFDGHNYLRRVIQQALGLMKDNGHMFLGDIMDLDLKHDLICDMKNFKRVNANNNFKTKIDWSEELFLSRGFLEDLRIDLPQIASVDFSGKISTIDNELTKFRYDALLTVNKLAVNKHLEEKKNKYQHDANSLTQFSKTRLKSNFSSSSVAYIIYTSGSTGKPKGAIIEHRNVINLLFNETTKFDFNNRDVWTMFHSHSFDFSVWEMYGALLFGGKLVLIPRMLAVDTEEYLNLLEDKQVTILNQTPSVFNNIAELALENEINLNFRYVILGGEALQLANLRSWLEKYPSHKLINMFGITEITVHATYKELSLQDIQLGKSNIGKAIPGYQSYVMDGNMKIQPIGVVGELFIAGDGVSRGYLNKVELANERFVENPFERGQKLYKTGDLARMLPNSDLEYCGRADDQVKIRGFRIELGEIENNILSKEEIIKCVVIVKTDEQKNRYLCAYVVLVNSECDIDNLKLREYLSTYLPDYMIPSYFVAIDQIPLTLNGKVNRKLLPNHEIKAGKDYKAPETKIENILVDIWSEVLKIPREEISINANFFELGGHSLKATVVTSKIHKELDIKMPLKEIFRKPTISELSKYLEKREKSNFTFIKPVEKKEYYQASSVQKRMIIIQHTNPTSTAYNMPALIELPYEVDNDLIEKTILSVLNRHSSFRTYFETVNGVMVQRLIDQCSFNLEVIKTSEDELDENVKRCIKPFNLSVTPIFRAILFEIKDQRKLILMDMHHIVSDGVSHLILEDNFRQLLDGQNVKPLRLQYNDYSEWLNSYTQIVNRRKQEKFWFNKFSDEIPALNLPTDFVRPQNKTFDGASIKFFLDQKETEFLKIIAKEQDLTLYMVMLSVFNVLLAKLSRQEDIIVGTPVAARRHADLESIVGMFINTLTVRNYPSNNKTVEIFMQEVRGYCLDAFENQEYSYEDLLEGISFNPDKSRNPLFDVMFNVLNQMDNKEEFGNVELNLHTKANVKFDINFKVLDNDKKLLCIFDYSTSLFKASTIERYIQYLRKIISQLMEKGINATIGEVELISETKKKNVLNLFNRNLECNLKRNTIQESLMNSFENHGDRVAICTADFNITYSKLIEESNKIQQSILDKGCSRGDIVGVYSSNKIEIITSILAIINCGGVFVPLDTNIPSNRLRLMSEEVSLKYLIVGEGETSSISWFENSNGTEKSVILNFALNFRGTKEINLEEFYSDDIVYIYFTSGSTGVPKAIAGSNKGLQHFIEWESQQFNVTENHKVSLFTNPGFDPFLRDILVPLFNGGCVEIPNNLDIILSSVKLVNWINRYGINLIHMVPGLFKILTDSSLGKGDFKALNHVLLAGEQIQTNSLRNWYEKMGERIQLVNVYGPTETTLAKMFHLIRSEDTLKERIPVGKTIDGSEAIILDENLNICDAGISGEIHIRTPYRSKGYVNQPEFFNQMFISNPFNNDSKDVIYKTGDIGVQNADGLIEIVGRKNNQVKIRGMRIELGDIEKTLLQLKGIKDVVAILSKSDNNNSFIIAYYVLKDSATKPGNINSRFDIKKEKLSVIHPDKMITNRGNTDYCCVDAYKLEENNCNSFNEFMKLKIENSPNEIAILNAKDSFSYQKIDHLSNNLFKLIMEKYDDTGALSKFEQERYNRQILIDKWGIENQEKLKNTTVFVAGAGGSGSPLIMQLALCGVGTIVVCDFDEVENSNLNRQCLHNESRIGINKAESAKKTIHSLNPNVNVIAISERITKENAYRLVGNSEIIFDNVDDMETKFVLSKCAVDKKIPQIISSMIDINSYVAIFHTPYTPCFHCLYDENILADIAKIKSVVNDYEKVSLPVASPSLFLSTGFAVNEALKIIIGLGDVAYNKYFLFNQKGTSEISNTSGHKLITMPFSKHFRNICLEQGFDWDNAWRGNFVEELDISKDCHCRLCSSVDENAKNGEEKNQFVQKSNQSLYGNIQTENKKIVSLVSEGYQNLAIYFAVVKLGMSYVSLDVTETEENLRFIINDSESRLIISNNTTDQLVVRLRDKVNKNISIINIDTIEEIDSGNDLSLEIQSGYGNFISYCNNQMTQFKTSDLRQYLLRELPEYMVPSYFQEIEEIPHNNNGKVNRRALPKLKLTNDDYEAPSNDIEKRLAEIWSDVLDLHTDEISVMASFLELGGHSLIAARVITLIHKEFNIEITLPDIFENQKIRELASLLSILDVNDNLLDCEIVKEIYI